jgi:hypothetical protein
VSWPAVHRGWSACPGNTVRESSPVPLALCPGMRYICGMSTTHTTDRPIPHPAVAAAWAALEASIQAHTCRICGKFATHRHVRETRAAHADHMARFGWSGMCAAPQQD